MLKVIYTNAQGKKKSMECLNFDVRDDSPECCVLTFLGEQVGTQKAKQGKKYVQVPTHEILGRAFGVTYYEVIDKDAPKK